MGTYRQPGIYVHKGFEQLNKQIDQGNKNFLNAYKITAAQYTANKKANAAKLAEARKGYQKWGDLVNKVQKEKNFKFDDESQKLIDAAGEEYWRLVGSNKKEDMDRLTQLETFPDQLMRMMAVGKGIGDEFLKSYGITQGKGMIDEERTPGINVGYADNIALHNGDKIMPVELKDKNGKGTGVLVSRYYSDKGSQTEIYYENNQAKTRNYEDFDNNKLYELMIDENNPFQFIYTKGDLYETLNPYMDFAKGEKRINASGKVEKGDSWYTNASKATDEITYVKVDPTDPDYNAATPYKKITTSTTHYNDNIPGLERSLNNVSMNNLMKTGDASWVFSDVINWAREKELENISQGGTASGDFTPDDDAEDTEGDNLFYTDDNGDIQSIPWVMDPTSPTSNYPNTQASKNATKLQQAMFNKYVKAYMLDPENGFIPEDQAVQKQTTYISKKQYDNLSKTTTSSSGRRPTNLDQAVLYANDPGRGTYVNPRYGNQKLSPYQFDIAAAEDALYKAVPASGGNPPTLDKNVRKSKIETMNSIVSTLNNPNLVGEDYTKDRSANNVPDFESGEQMKTKLENQITQQEAIANKQGVSAADKAAAELKIKSAKKNLKEIENRISSTDTGYYYYKKQGKWVSEKIDLTGSDVEVQARIEDLFHRYNGIVDATRKRANQMKKI